MNMPDPKALKKLASACRKAGVKSFKCADFEFQLSDEAMEIERPKKSATTTVESLIDEDTLTDEELLLWSAGEESQAS